MRLMSFARKTRRDGAAMQALKEVWCNEQTDRAPEEDGVVVREGIAQDAGGGERERGGYLVFGGRRSAERRRSASSVTLVTLSFR